MDVAKVHNQHLPLFLVGSQADASLDTTFAEPLFAKLAAGDHVQLAGSGGAFLLPSGDDPGPCSYQFGWANSNRATRLHFAIC